MSKSRAHGFLKVGQFFDHVVDVVGPYSEFLATGRLTHEASVKGIVEILVTVRRVFFSAVSDTEFAARVQQAFGKSVRAMSEDEAAVLHSRLITMKTDEIAVGMGWARPVETPQEPTVVPAPEREAIAPVKGARK